MAGSGLQSGTIPYRRAASGALEILLITSRKRGRWILPKGKVARGMLAHHSAARETMQEAGVLGNVDLTPIAEIFKQRGKYEPGTSRLLMYPLIVTSELARWPEDHQRKRRWMPVDRAIKKLESPPLRKVLRQFAVRCVPKAQS